MKKLLVLFVLVLFSFSWAQEKSLTILDRAVSKDTKINILGHDGKRNVNYEITDFESEDFPPAGWTIEWNQQNFWAMGDVSAYGIGVHCAIFEFYSAYTGTTQSLVSPTFSPVSSYGKFIFDHAYAPYNNGEDDQLQINYSTDAGTTWTELVLLHGGLNGELVTAPQQGGVFIPTASQWATKTFNLPAGTNKIKLTTISDYGQYLYLDNFRIGDPPANDVGMYRMELASNYLPGTVTPKVTVKNFGSSTNSFNVTLTADGYSSTRSITSLAGDSSLLVSFDDWQASIGTTGFTAYTVMSGDANSANDTLTKSVVVADAEWHQITPSIDAVSRSCCAFITVGDTDYIYQFGGGSGQGMLYFFRMNLTTNTWSNLGMMPLMLSQGTAVAVDDSLIYVFGGYTSDSTSSANIGKAAKYNVITKTWTTLADMPTPVTDAAIVKYGNYIYIIGGGNGMFCSVTTANVQRYDPSTNTYTVATSLPQPMAMMGTGIIGNTIYTFAGWDGYSAVATSYKGVIDESNPLNITWTPVEDYPGGIVVRVASSPVVKDGNTGVVCAGGMYDGATVIANSYLWNHTMGRWEGLPSISVARSNMKATGKGNRAYVIAGYTADDLGTGAAEYIEFNSILPVEFTAFTAAAENNNVTLNWSTASETNNKGFQVERKSASGSFEQVSFVNGKGTTTERQSYTYMDNNLATGKYVYRLKQVDFNGSISYSNEVIVNVNIPDEFSLEQNYPNPFNPATKINFSLASDSKVTLKVYSILGEEVATLLSGGLTAGQQSISFNAANLPSGVYIYKLEAAGIDGTHFSAVKKMMLLK